MAVWYGFLPLPWIVPHAHCSVAPSVCHLEGELSDLPALAEEASGASANTCSECHAMRCGEYSRNSRHKESDFSPQPVIGLAEKGKLAHLLLVSSKFQLWSEEGMPVWNSHKLVNRSPACSIPVEDVLINSLAFLLVNFRTVGTR